TRHTRQQTQSGWEECPRSAGTGRSHEGKGASSGSRRHMDESPAWCTARIAPVPVCIQELLPPRTGLGPLLPRTLRVETRRQRSTRPCFALLPLACYCRVCSCCPPAPQPLPLVLLD